MARRDGRTILDFYPYPTFRIGHRETLQTIESMWDQFDVALIVAPVASGKTALRRAISYFKGDANMLVPTNALIQQELEEFPDTRKIMKRAEFYKCDFCYDMDMEAVTKRGHPILTVPHMMIAHKLRRKVLIVDEGHKLIAVNQDLQAINMWRRNMPYPLTTYTRPQLEEFLKLNQGIKNGDKILTKLRTDDYFVKRERAAWRSQDLDRIRLIPMTPDLHPALGAAADKIILLSATLSDEDVRDLGVAKNKRVIKIEVPSPIPAANRPLVKSYVGGLSHNNLESMAPAIARRIMDIAAFHGSGKKGIVHVTYGLATILRKYLHSDRIIWHDNTNSKTQLAAWMRSRDGIFIASGFEEGLNLAGPDYEWQIITKVQWQSLGDVAIRKRAEQSQAWYLWQALKMVIQSYGRICRGPTDEGVTYILDSTFERLVTESLKHDLIPKFFREVL